MQYTLVLLQCDIRLCWLVDRDPLLGATKVDPVSHHPTNDFMPLPMMIREVAKLQLCVVWRCIVNGF